MVARCTFLCPKMDSLAADVMLEKLSRLLMETLKLDRTRKRLAPGCGRIDVKAVGCRDQLASGRVFVIYFSP